MEVHSHTHTPRKKWSHYFWEFLMLFLAVFCGFLAEYQLEHKIEKQRAKQYIISFYQDLKTDTSEFSELIELDNAKLKVLYTVYDCYDTLELGLDAKPCLKTLMAHSASFYDLIYSDRTLQQLKNAGGMRLLKKEDADSILAYDHRLRRYLGYESSLLQERQSNLRNTYSDLISFKGMKAVRFPDDSIAVLTNESLLISADKKDINKLFNEIFMYAQSIKTARITQISRILENAKRLLIYFKEKYHLE